MWNVYGLMDGQTDGRQTLSDGKRSYDPLG
jgi:hypothetical protein